MEIIKIEKEAIVLDAEERKKLKECLNYCYHRLTQHKECGLMGIVKENFVEYMRDNL